MIGEHIRAHKPVRCPWEGPFKYPFFFFIPTFELIWREERHSIELLPHKAKNKKNLFHSDLIHWLLKFILKFWFVLPCFCVWFISVFASLFIILFPKHQILPTGNSSLCTNRPLALCSDSRYRTQSTSTETSLRVFTVQWDFESSDLEALFFLFAFSWSAIAIIVYVISGIKNLLVRFGNES